VSSMAMSARAMVPTCAKNSFSARRQGPPSHNAGAVILPSRYDPLYFKKLGGKAH